MFYKCTSLKNLNLISFNTSFNNDLDGMFYGINEDCIVKTNDYRIENILNL
jgi:surface protein